MIEPKAPMPAAAPPATTTPPAPRPVAPAVNLAEATQAIVNDPAVKKAMEVFNARIINVEPRRT